MKELASCVLSSQKSTGGVQQNKRAAFSLDTGINPELAKLHPVLDKAADAGSTIMSGYGAGSKSITLATAGPMPVVRSRLSKFLTA